jgi:hypothetical protein
MNTNEHEIVARRVAPASGGCGAVLLSLRFGIAGKNSHPPETGATQVFDVALA